MISATEANESTKYFTHEWSITIPTRPRLKYVHVTPKISSKMLELTMDPKNHPYFEHGRNKVWDEAAMEDFTKIFADGYRDAKTKYDRLAFLVELDSEAIGFVNLRCLPPAGPNNIGLLFTEKARGKGLGKFTMQFILQLARNIGIENLEAGTMKVNQPMRKLMESLKIPEREENKEDPARGVIVAEILYTIPEAVSWDDIDMIVEFGPEAFA
ncbi:hypothetical protein B7463_g11107, partial [Scytalidium lignicola]